MSLKPQVVVVIVAVVLLIYAAFAFDLPYGNKIDDFETCIAAGNPVMEVYPRQCRDRKGNLFIEDIAVTPVPPLETGTTTASTTPSDISGTGTTTQVQRACKPTGCSGQICSDEDVASTCEFMPKYMCYKSAVCERQATGLCGWTETPELKACLTNPPRTE
jgi:hypothetical protein